MGRVWFWGWYGVGRFWKVIFLGVCVGGRVLGEMWYFDRGLFDLGNLDYLNLEVSLISK